MDPNEKTLTTKKVEKLAKDENKLRNLTANQRKYLQWAIKTGRVTFG